MESQNERVWFITGASTGFGRAIAKLVASQGMKVVATARDLQTLETLTAEYPSTVHGAPLDVTSADSIDAAVRSAIDTFGRIDVLVNNAGHGFLGATEEVSDADTRAVMDVNVFGALAVTRRVLPHMRAQRTGHIIQMSSVGGQVGNPGHSVYAMSKFALEGFSEALAGEVASLGIRVTIVEPGPFRTDFAGRSIGIAQQIEDYASTPAGLLRERFGDQDGQQPNDPVRAAEIIVAWDADPTAPLRLPLGPEAVDRIRSKLRNQLADIDKWESVLVDTRFEN